MNREDVYWLDAEKYQQDVAMIEEHENSWIGKIVVARNNTDGLYYHGVISAYITIHLTIVLEGCISQYTRLLYWRAASYNTLDYCIGGLHLTIH